MTKTPTPDNVSEARLPEAFVTANSGDGQYWVKIKCATMADMHRWHDAVLAAYTASARTSTAPVAEDGSAIMLSLADYMARIGIVPNEGPTGAVDDSSYVLTLPAGRCNDLVTTGMLKALAVAHSARWADIHIRKDGKWTRFEADWLQYLQVSLASPPPPQPAVTVTMKPLEWKREHGGVFAASPLGEYGVVKTRSGSYETCNQFSCHFEESEAAGVAWCEADYETRIRSALAASIPQGEGMQLVPINPTRAMILDGYNALMNWDARTGDDYGIYEVYTAMLKAALAATVSETEQKP